MNMAYLSQNNDSLVFNKEEDAENFTFSQQTEDDRQIGSREQKRKKR